MRSRILAAPLVYAGLLLAQGPPPGGMHDQGGPGPRMGRGPGDDGRRPPQFPASRPRNEGGNEKWWTDPLVVRRLGLSEDQQRRIDDVFQKNRLRLIDLKAVLEKEEALLEPLLAADRPDEQQVLAHVDRVAAARSELERANARMLFGFRLVLSTEQWRQLQTRNEPRPSSRGPHL